MKLSLNWILDFVEMDRDEIQGRSGLSPNDLANKLTMSTAEVEGVETKGEDVKGVVVGEIKSIADHPRSEKLRVITVDTGSALIQSVCGAPNIKVGMRIPFALPGASLPGMPEVRSVNVDGIRSNGIACSQRELGVGDSHEGVMEITDACALGDDVKTLLGLDDVIIELDNKSLTNRPDLWSHYGFAREVAALTGARLKPLTGVRVEELIDQQVKVRVDIRDTGKCMRYCALGIDGVDTRPSPAKMQTRLAYVGMRPINLMVDLTNYVMLEAGQPMHAFDSRTIDGVRVMTMSQLLESGDCSEPVFTTLDGNRRQIPAETLMICNLQGPVAVAGIMGGLDSEVTPETRSILLESATFDPVSIRKSALALGLRTEASMRFEKSLDTNLALTAVQRFVYLLKQVIPSASISSGLCDVHPRPTRPIELEITEGYINRYVGQAIGAQRIEDILGSLGFGVRMAGEDDGVRWKVTVPTYRATKDVSIPVDLVEEVARIYGYDEIKPQPKVVTLSPLPRNRESQLTNDIKDVLALRFGLSEVHTYSWYDREWNKAIGHSDEANLEIVNPGISKYDILRRHLVPNLLAAVAKNEGFFDRFGIFEVGSVYHPSETLSGSSLTGKAADALRIEERHLAVIEHWKGGADEAEDQALNRMKQMADEVCRCAGVQPAAFGAIRSDVTTATDEERLAWLHPVKRCSVSAGNRRLGYITIIGPSLLGQFDQKANMAVMELNLQALMGIEPERPRYQEPPRYPQVKLDFSIVTAKSLPYAQLLTLLKEFNHDYLKSISYVATYSGKGLKEDQKSVTVALTIGSDHSTLSSQHVEEFSSDFVSWLRQRGLSLR